MALTIGIKSLSIDNTSYGIKTQSFEYMVSGSEKTEIVDEITGNLIGVTQERKAGMIKFSAVLLNANDNNTLRTIDGSEMVIELESGLVITGKNMVQTAMNTSTVSDGFTEYEFKGNVRQK
tara:strand:- start:1945 stop:2307 length:363 start_codon:yes stop_codon:yes gene_type:complete